MSNYIFVDIDGVINPRQQRAGGFRRYTPKGGFRRAIHRLSTGRNPFHYLNLHRDYGQWLRGLSADTGAELAWGTAWEDTANRWAGRPLGLHLPFLRLHREPGTSLGYRKAMAANQLPEDARFVYFDDEPDLGEYLNRSGGKHIWVNPETGLQPCHIAEAREFLTSVTAMTAT